MKALVVCKPSNAERSSAANSTHKNNIKTALTAIKKSGIDYHTIELGRDTLDADTLDVHDCEIVIAIGGDGTLLTTSHYVDDVTPTLSVNSAPGYSEGFFSGCDVAELDKWISFIESVHYDNESEDYLTHVTRMKISITDENGNTELITNRGLNDALFCHNHPALTTRYSISPKNRRPEYQMSSGVWFSTAAGSTAAIRSAGGFTMPYDSENIQYLVREPYQPRNGRYQSVHGFICEEQKVKIISHIKDGCVYVDGAHINHSVRNDYTLIIEQSLEPLSLINFRRKIELT